MSTLHNWILTTKRIPRVRRELPAFVYRWDDRGPEAIRQTGFYPRVSAWGDVALWEHESNTYQMGPRAGKPCKDHSQWVSTGAYGIFKTPDFLAGRNFLYKIDTGKALAGSQGLFWDMGYELKRAGLDQNYPQQFEWTKEGGIPPQAIVAYMTSRAFLQLYSRGIPDDENAMQGWLRMPDRAP